MTEENKKYLRTTYSKFITKNCPIDCEDGWFTIIDSLFKTIQYYSINNPKYGSKLKSLSIAGIKEKFGILSFQRTYVEEFDGLFNFATFLSEAMCETCGSTDNVTQTKGWVVTKCEKCMKKHLGSQGWIKHKESLR